jgi:adenylate cyclase
MRIREILMKRKRLAGSLLGLFIGTLAILLYSLGAFDAWELASYDARFRLRNRLGSGVAADHRIILVGLDEESLKRPDRKTGSWTRDDFTRIINALSESGAELICLDVLFSREKDAGGDARLARAIFDSNRVILASDISEDNRAVPLPLFRAGEVGEGFINLMPDRADGVVRRIPLQRVEKTGRDGGTVTHVTLPFAQQVAYACLYPYDPPPIRYPSEDRLMLGGLEIPQTRQGMLINFIGNPGAFPKISAWEILRHARGTETFQGKIVLIGSMRPVEHDAYPTPFHGTVRKEKSIFKEKKFVSGRHMYGIEIHANALNTILTRRFISPVSTGLTFFILAALCVAATLFMVTRKSGGFTQAAIAFSLILGYAAVSYVCFVKARLWLQTVPALVLIFSIFIGGMLYHRALEAWNRRQIVHLFGKYVSKGVVDLLVRHPEQVSLGGKKARLTVLFSDIRGFTAMTERADPRSVSDLLNAYFESMTIILFSHGGTLDKFMGDGLMAFFGDPVACPDHAVRAVQTGLDMMDRVSELREQWRREGKTGFEIGIGINTGEMIVGNHGSGEFFDYTVIGDEVNLASRLEKKARGSQILISEAVCEAVKGHFEIESLGTTAVKGKADPVKIYQVLGRKNQGG